MTRALAIGAALLLAGPGPCLALASVNLVYLKVKYDIESGQMK